MSRDSCPLISRRDLKGTRDGRVSLQGSYTTFTMTEIYVKVKPGQEKFDIEMNTFPEISLKQEAEQGKANTELVNELTEILGKKPGIVSGHQSRRKKIAVDMEEDKIMEKLRGYNG